MTVEQLQLKQTTYLVLHVTVNSRSEFVVFVCILFEKSFVYIFYVAMWTLRMFVWILTFSFFKPFHFDKSMLLLVII